MKNLGSAELLEKLDSNKAKETIENKLRESQNDLDLIFQQYLSSSYLDIKQKQIFRKYSTGTPSPKKFNTQQFQNNLSSKALNFKDRRYTLNSDYMNRSLSNSKKTLNKQQNEDLGLKSSLSWFDEMTEGKSNQIKEKLKKIVLKRTQNKYRINPMSALDITQEEKQELNSKTQQTTETTFQTLHQPQIQNSESVEFIEFQKNFKTSQMLLNAIVLFVLITLGLCLFRLI